MGITIIICAAILFAVCIGAFTVLVLKVKDKLKPEDYDQNIVDLKVEMAGDMANTMAEQKIMNEKIKSLNLKNKELADHNMKLIQHNTSLNALIKELESKQVTMVAKKRKAK